MSFTGSRQAPFFNFHVETGSLFQFPCHLQGRDRLPLSISMLFTGSRQAPFVNFHVIFRVETGSLFSISMLLTGSRQAPFFNVHVIYRVRGLLFERFTGCFMFFTFVFKYVHVFYSFEKNMLKGKNYVNHTCYLHTI